MYLEICSSTLCFEWSGLSFLLHSRRCFFCFGFDDLRNGKTESVSYTVENYDDCGVIAGNYLILKSIYRQTADSRQTKAHEAE